MKYEESRKAADDNYLSCLRMVQEPWDDNYEFGMMFPVPGVFPRKYMIATGIEVEELEDSERYTVPWKPFMKLNKKTVQDLFNQMWSAGFRPKDGTGNSGHVEAMKYHLEDMRKLVFK